MRLAKFHYRGDSATGQQTVLNNFGGLTLIAGCVANDFDFFARNDSGEAAEMVWNKVANGAATSGSTFSPFNAGATDNNLGVTPDDSVTGQITFKSASDKIVTVNFSLYENLTAPRCSATGTAIAG